MNKILKTLKLKKRSKVLINFGESNEIILRFDEDTITISQEHDQDCCESVYADFEYLAPYIPQINKEYSRVVIKGVDRIGILICFEIDEYFVGEKVLIPCYNEQNGYYSTELKLIVNHNGVKDIIDIEEYEESYIN